MARTVNPATTEKVAKSVILPVAVAEWFEDRQYDERRKPSAIMRAALFEYAAANGLDVSAYDEDGNLKTDSPEA